MSQITPSNVNGNFPVFGQDNSTQGFRDNFTNIKNNLTFAKQEIEELQNKAVLKSSLTGSTLTNDLKGTQIIGAQLKETTQSYLDLGELSGDVTIDFTQGNFQKITAIAPINITLQNWPATSGSGLVGYASVRIWIVSQPYFNNEYSVFTPSTVTFGDRDETDTYYKVNIGMNDIADVQIDTNTINFDTAGNYVFDVSSADGGQNFLIFDTVRNRVRFRDPSFYYNPDVNPTLIIGFTDEIATAVAVSTGVNTITTKGTINSYSGVRDRGNTPGLGVYGVYVQTEEMAGNSGIGGFSISATRGYVDPATNQFTQDSRSLVENNDYIGRVNFIGSSLDSTVFPNSFEPAFCEFATLRSFVTGYAGGGQTGNLVPGGNLVIMTKRDGLISPQQGYVHPAMSLENDQSAHFYGGTVNYGAEATNSYQYVNLDSVTDYIVPEDCPIVILASDTYTPATAINIMMPAGSRIKDGTKITFAAQVDIASLTFPNSVTSTFINEAYIPATIPGFPGVTILTTVADPLIEKGMAIVAPPYYFSNQVILDIIDNDYNGYYSSLANVVISANADSAASPGITSLDLYSYVAAPLVPMSMTTGDTWTLIYRAYNQFWYKI